ncbi:MAG: hypothetical protein PHQ52_06290 [Candidatus Omnitrophica bacterium]|nr:hypothetical protein [Candidatus Omnitrophota bacterium]
MFIGAILIISGVFIAIFPELLSLIVASMLIIVGLTMCTVSYRMKKSRDSQSNVTGFFTKF